MMIAKMNGGEATPRRRLDRGRPLALPADRSTRLTQGPREGPKRDTAVTRRYSGPRLLPLTVIRGLNPAVRRQCSPMVPKNTRKSF